MTHRLLAHTIITALILAGCSTSTAPYSPKAEKPSDTAPPRRAPAAPTQRLPDPPADQAPPPAPSPPPKPPPAPAPPAPAPPTTPLYLTIESIRLRAQPGPPTADVTLRTPTPIALDAAQLATVLSRACLRNDPCRPEPIFVNRLPGTPTASRGTLTAFPAGASTQTFPLGSTLPASSDPAWKSFPIVVKGTVTVSHRVRDTPRQTIDLFWEGPSLP